jgi:hypothetical protein
MAECGHTSGREKKYPQLWNILRSFVFKHSGKVITFLSALPLKALRYMDLGHDILQEDDVRFAARELDSQTSCAPAELQYT